MKAIVIDQAVWEQQFKALLDKLELHKLKALERVKDSEKREAISDTHRAFVYDVCEFQQKIESL